MKSFVELIRQNVQASSRNVDVKGMKKVNLSVKKLMDVEEAEERGGDNSSNSSNSSSSSSVGWEKLQRELIIESERFDPVLQFADALHVSRFSIHNQWFTQRKQE